MNADVKQMIRELRRQGIVTQVDGRSHYKLVRDGVVIRDERGMPVTLPGSPNHSALNNTRRRLVTMGLLPR